MENAVKALLIAAGVLIGIMILSLGVSLYSSLGSYVRTTQEAIVSKRTQEFNNKFTKYINCDNSGNIEFQLTIQDVVTAANTAYENNLEYNLDSYTENNYYVIINMGAEKNLEKIVDTKMSEILEKGYDKKYKCSINNIKINSTTGRVYQVTFEEF